MGYATAINKTWDELANRAKEERFEVKFLNDAYSVDLRGRSVSSLSCNVPAKEHAAIIILHYLNRKLALQGLPELTNEWIDFNQLEGGEEYYPSYKRRTIDVLIRKYGASPDKFLEQRERFSAKKSDSGDVGLIIPVFGEVPLLINLWSSDDEFGPDANILFDKNIKDIFCTEDVVVLTEIVVRSL